MWEYEHSEETTAAPEALWACWRDVPNWPEWNDDIAAIEIAGPFAVGTEITMTPKGEDPVILRIAELTENEVFTDEAEFGGVVVRTSHRIAPAGPSRTKVTYRTEITGPAAGELGPQVGPAITADFPETIRALIERAQG